MPLINNDGFPQEEFRRSKNNPSIILLIINPISEQK